MEMAALEVDLAHDAIQSAFGALRKGIKAGRGREFSRASRQGTPPFGTPTPVANLCVYRRVPSTRGGRQR